ncbi:hypothetical protein CL620_03595 [archaeon]|nr:hypothetical protein [archaeon]
MIDILIIQRLLIALALGALVGLEREYASYRKKGHQFAGIRTFPLIALFGGVAAYFGETVSVWIFVVSSFMMGLLIVLAYIATSDHGKKHVGATSEVAGLLTFLVGALAYYGEINFAAIVAVIMTVILYSRSMLHHFTQKITGKELADTLKFAIIAFVILPFLPNQAYGPQELFNPYIIWLMVVFISGISFAGYIAMKWFGERGITLAAILGGLASSTAVTMSFAARSAKQKKIFAALALGVILANGIMFIRILIEVFVINRELFWEMLFPLVSLALITLFFSYFMWKHAKQVKGKIELGSPFTLKPALKFGIFFAVILALVKLADVYLSSQGVYIVSLISGFADVDAITVSLSQLAKESLSLDIARNGIMIAALTNVAVKGGIAWWFGGRKFRNIVVSLFLVLILFGLALSFLL